MGMEIATQQYPVDRHTGLTLPLSKSLGLQDLTRHRAMVALELEVLAKKFDRFGWDRDRDSHAQDRLIVDWMDALQDYPLDEVKAACRAAVRDNPNKMPNEGHIVSAILAARKQRIAYLPKAEPIEDRQKVSPEEARAILASAGFGFKRMDAAE